MDLLDKVLTVLLVFMVSITVFVIVHSCTNTAEIETICRKASYSESIFIDDTRYCYRYNESGDIELLKFEIAKMRIDER